MQTIIVLLGRIDMTTLPRTEQKISTTRLPPETKPLLCARCGQPIERTDNATFFLQHIFWKHVDQESACPSAEPPVYEVPKKKGVGR
jgi:hypothetical protein